MEGRSGTDRRRIGSHRDRRNRPCVRLFAAIAALLCVAAASVASAVTLTEVQAFGSNPGALRMFKYVPPSLPASAPLVVALHGCTQRASDYGDETGWTDLARRLQFALLLPEQSGQRARADGTVDDRPRHRSSSRCRGPRQRFSAPRVSRRERK